MSPRPMTPAATPAALLALLLVVAAVLAACATPAPRPGARTQVDHSGRTHSGDAPSGKGPDKGSDKGSDNGPDNGGDDGAGSNDHSGQSTGGLRPQGPVGRGWRVSRVIDGDTVEVSTGGRTLDVRLIGIDTPETVHPTEPIECYGPEASAFAERELAGEPVLLEFDPSQGRRDYYGRTLAYVWLTERAPRLFNLEAIRRGYALEYTYDDAYQWQQQFQRAEQRARTADRGVWRCPRPGS